MYRFWIWFWTSSSFLFEWIILTWTEIQFSRYIMLIDELKLWEGCLFWLSSEGCLPMDKFIDFGASNTFVESLHEEIKTPEQGFSSEWRLILCNISLSFVRSCCNTSSIVDSHRLKVVWFGAELEGSFRSRGSVWTLFKLFLATWILLLFAASLGTVGFVYLPIAYRSPWHQPLWNTISFADSSLSKWIMGMTIDITIASGKWMFGILNSWICAPSKAERTDVVMANISTADATKHIRRDTWLRFSPRR